MTNPNLTPRGPFHTADEAFDAAAPLREAVHAIDPHDRLMGDLRTRWINARAQYVTEILTACGVQLGAQDERTARWIAATLDQPETAVILDWILRAHQGAPQVEDEQPVLHWPARGLRITTLCQGEPLTAADFADNEADATCPECRAVLDEAAVVHALPPIDFPGRVAGVEPGPRCGAQRGRTALFAADVDCPQCRALLEAEGTR